MHAREFVASYIDAWNRKDSRAIADHLDENGTYLDIPVHQEMTQQQFLEHLEELFELETYSYELTGEVLFGEHTIAFQYKASPRDPGVAEREPEPWYGAEFLTMQSDTAVEIVDYYEQHGVTSPASPVAASGRARRVQRYAKSGLSSNQMEAVKNRLRVLMESERTWLHSDLTLPELARSMGCSVNHLSQVINAGFGMSFFDFLNQYRVEEAKRLLRPDNAEPETVLSVALQVGFNSTSTFYVAFKKVTGQTPAQYRRQLKAASNS